MDYKATLNLPKTSFSMKGNLPQTEPKVLAQWEKDRLYHRILSQRDKEPPFVLHDGPPYANGDIHIGHALNKILKDMIVRFQMMQGKRAHYVPGWDCHGLPIEYALMRELKVTKHQVNVVDFRKKARAYALKYVDIQREQFKRLGCLGDWERPYLTLDSDYVAAALRALATLVSKGYVYRARKPVNWCWSCETALAEAEVEYEQRPSPSLYMKFPLTAESAEKFGGIEPGVRRGTYLVVWTTTPWTLMGNVAVAVHPEFEYAVRHAGPNEEWITLESLPVSGRSDLGVREDSHPIKRKVRGKGLEELVYQHPLLSREGKVVLADYVSSEDGTGLVHIAPGFGAEDYATGKRCNLEVLTPVDSQGKFVGLPKEVAQLNGRQVQDSNEEVINLLRKGEFLIKSVTLQHPYPHCWRCHSPIIFRSTDQWFLNVEKDGLRQKLLEAAEGKVEWIPSLGKERMAGMLKTRPDWCLSRQRLWGIPIPAVLCGSCGKGILDPRIVESFAKAVETDPEGSDRWFTEPVERWLPSGLTCEDCKGKSFEAGADILDVWFDSGVSHQGVLKRREGLSFPADLYLEGSDQHRGWFQVSLITSVALNGQGPFRAVLTHGFVVDGEGRKMSKSMGNVIAPQEVIAQYGADVLRLWVASSDYREDVRLSPEILSQMAEVYRKIRNTIRFCLANVSDFQPTESVPAEKMRELDRWALSKLSALLEEVTRSYREHAYHRVSKAVHEFCVVRLSNFYLDVLKDRLYTSAPNDPARRSAQTALFQIVRTLILVMAPIFPMTAEEVWAALTGAGDGGSVHLQNWPQFQDLPRDSQIEPVWDKLLELRDEVMKVLEGARAAGQIGDPLEAELELGVEEPLWKLLEPREADFADACVVSGLKLVRTTEGSVRIGVRRAGGTKCQRCWKRLSSVGQSADHPGLCARCVQVVQLWYTPGLR